MATTQMLDLGSLELGTFPRIAFWDRTIWAYGGIATGPAGQGDLAYCAIDREVTKASPPKELPYAGAHLIDVAAEPIGESGEDRVRIFLQDRGGIFFVHPDAGDRHAVGGTFANDPNIWRCTAGGHAGCYLVSSGAGYGESIVVEAWSWAGLQAGKPPEHYTCPIPGAWRAGNENYGQRAAVAADGDPGSGSDVLVVALNAPRVGVMEVPLTFDRQPTFTALPGVHRVFDLHHGPRGDVSALCGMPDLSVWARKGPGDWTDQGDPSTGALPRPAGANAVCCPVPQPPGAYEHVIVVVPAPQATAVYAWRGIFEPFG